MPCHAMHPIQDLFLESFSYVLQFYMHFICTPMWTKIFVLVKSGCYTELERLRIARLTRCDQAVRLLDMQRLHVVKDT
jgi:hypothetical protein